MKKFLCLFVLLVSSSAFGFYKKERLQVTRTSSNQNQIVLDMPIPSYENVCETRDVFGPDPFYCGYEYVPVTVCNPQGCYTTYVQQVRSCYHPEQYCYDKVDNPHAGYVHFTVNFDNAPLSQGQTEKFQFSYDFDKQSAYVLVKDAIYHYEQNDYGVPAVDLGGQAAFELRKK